MKKVIIYARVSTGKQTVEQQERTVFAWLAVHNMQATHTITDEGVSGGVSYAQRNLGKTVLPMLAKGDTLIVSEISRLGRSMSDINKLVADELKPRGVRLVVVQMGIDLNCAEIRALDEMLLFAFSFAAQLEKELIQNRTRSAMEVRKEKLRAEGSYTSKSGRTVIHLGNAPGTDLSKAQAASAIKRTEQARANPNNRIIWGLIGGPNPPSSAQLRDMADRLNAMGVLTSTRLTFTPERVRSAYHNLKKIYRNAQ